MSQAINYRAQLPIFERLKNIPGFFGIRLSEEPQYRVLDMDDEKEIREYGRMTLASITLPGSYESAMEEGYYRLCHYLFGGNIRQTEMPMTTPIFEERLQYRWRISFILPKEMTAATAPTPKDHAIEIFEKPAHKAAVIWYTGGNDLERIHEKEAELNGWILNLQGYTAQSDVKIAQYDSPSTLSFFRRNELQVEVAEAH